MNLIILKIIEILFIYNIKGVLDVLSRHKQWL